MARKAQPKAAKKPKKSTPPTGESGPAAIGRPSDYRPEFCQTVIELGRIGAGAAEMALEIGVVRGTLWNWEKQHPEFLDAMKTAREFACGYWEKLGREGVLMGKQFNAAGYIFQVLNRSPADWRNKFDHTIDASITINVNKYPHRAET